jgi:hypothetical protein
MRINLLHDEEVIKESSDGTVVLTTHRLCSEQKELGRSYTQFILLENVSATELQQLAQWWQLFVGAFLVGVVFLVGRFSVGEAAVVAAIIALFFILRFRLTRKSYIIVTAPGSKIQINVTPMKQDSIHQFMNAVDKARNNRIIALQKATLSKSYKEPDAR